MVAIADHPMLVRVKAGEKPGTGRPAWIGLTIVPCKARGFPRQRIEMRRAGKRVAGRSQQIAAHWSVVISRMFGRVAEGGGRSFSSHAAQRCHLD